MPALEIPIASDAPHFVQENEIFGLMFHLEFEWIERQSLWMLHLSDGEKKPLVSGLKLNPNWPLFSGEFDGQVIALTLKGKNAKVKLGLNNLQSDFTLVAHAPF